MTDHLARESVVVWTSDAGADHELRSVDESGRTRWIEVKSTTGTGGRFECSPRGVDAAVRGRDRYKLWRVYLAGSAALVARSVVDPVALLGGFGLRLGLGTLPAALEDPA